MTIAQLIPAPAVQRLVDQFLDEAWRGRHALVHAFGWPERVHGANAPPAGLTYALTRVRRLLRLVRLTFLIVATWLEVRRRERRLPAGIPAASSGGVGKPTQPETPSLFPCWRARVDNTPPAPQPVQLAHAQRDRLRQLSRCLALLTRALLDPMPHVRKIARRLHRGYSVFVKPRAKRLPPCDRRDHLECLHEAASHADFERSRWWRERARQDSS